MDYRIHPWRGSVPYEDRNERNRRSDKPPVKRDTKCPFPWHKMKPGDSFYVPVNLNDEKTLHSLKNKLYLSAKNHRIYIKCYQGPIPTEPNTFGLKVIHDGPMK